MSTMKAFSRNEDDGDQISLKIVPAIYSTVVICVSTGIRDLIVINVPWIGPSISHRMEIRHSVPEAVTAISTFVSGSVHHVRIGYALQTKHTLIYIYPGIREKSWVDDWCVYRSFIIILSTANYQNKPYRIMFFSRSQRYEWNFLPLYSLLLRMKRQKINFIKLVKFNLIL